MTQASRKLSYFAGEYHLLSDRKETICPVSARKTYLDTCLLAIVLAAAVVLMHCLQAGCCQLVLMHCLQAGCCQMVLMHCLQAGGWQQHVWR